MICDECGQTIYTYINLDGSITSCVHHFCSEICEAIHENNSATKRLMILHERNIQNNTRSMADIKFDMFNDGIIKFSEKYVEKIIITYKGRKSIII